MANSEEVWKAFRQYDKDGSGSISMDELKEALEKFSTLKVTDEDIEQILRDADTNGDGEIGLVEFAGLNLLFLFLFLFLLFHSFHFN